MSDAVFATIGEALRSDPGLGKKVPGSFRFNITGPNEKAWLVDCKACAVSVDSNAKADCTITISEADFVSMAGGKLSGMQAFMSGKMKVKGNMGLAQKFSALVEAAKKTKTTPAPAASPPPASTTDFKSAAVFSLIQTNLAADAGLSKKVNGTFHFVITGGSNGKSSTWTVDAKTATPGVHEGTIGKPDVTITISDTDFVAMAEGKLKGMQAYMSGKMKLKGNMGLATKFAALVEARKAKL